MNKVHRKSKTIWNLGTIQFTLIVFLVGCAIYFVFSEYAVARKAFFLISIGSVLYLLVNLLKNSITYRQTGYQLTGNAVIIYHGGFTTSEFTVPLSKVQHLDVEQTFYSRFYNLYEITIYTGGDNHTIGFITIEEATKLKNFIIELLAQEGGKFND